MNLPTPSARRLLLAYVVALLGFLALDAVWLSSTSAPLYQPALGALMAAQVNWLAVALFYPLYLAGLLYFAVLPGLKARRAGIAGVRGALLGLLSYATYDLTNQATLQGWPWHITLIDMAWGGCVSGASAFAGGWAALRFTAWPTARA